MTRVLNQMRTEQTATSVNTDEDSAQLSLQKELLQGLSIYRKDFQTLLSQLVQLQGRTPDPVDQTIKQTLSNLLQIKPWFEDESTEISSYPAPTVNSQNRQNTNIEMLLKALAPLTQRINESNTPSQLLNQPQGTAPSKLQYPQLSVLLNQMLQQADIRMNQFSQDIAAVVTRYEQNIAKIEQNQNLQSSTPIEQSQLPIEQAQSKTSQAMPSKTSAIETSMIALIKAISAVETDPDDTKNITTSNTTKNQTIETQNKENNLTDKVTTFENEAITATAKKILFLLKTPEAFQQVFKNVQQNTSGNLENPLSKQESADLSQEHVTHPSKSDFANEISILKNIAPRLHSDADPVMTEPLLKVIQSLKSEQTIQTSPLVTASSTPNRELKTEQITQLLQQLQIKNNLQSIIAGQPQSPAITELLKTSIASLQQPIRNENELMNWVKFAINPLQHSDEQDSPANTFHELIKELIKSIPDPKETHIRQKELINLLKEETEFQKKDVEALLQQLTPHSKERVQPENPQPIFQLPLPHDPKLKKADSFQLKKRTSLGHDSGWQFTVTTHSTSVGSIQFQANLNVPNLSITIYAEKLTTVELIKSTLPVFENRLSLFGLNLKNSLVQQRKKIDDDPVATGHGFYTKA